MTPNALKAPMFALTALVACACAAPDEPAELEPEPLFGEKADSGDALFGRFPADGEGLPHVRAVIGTNSFGTEAMWLTYVEPRFSAVRPCQEPRTPVHALFIAGPAHDRDLFTVQMERICSSDHQISVGPSAPGEARVMIHRDSPLWDRIFPPNEDGERWYAMQLAFLTEADPHSPSASWDSNFGQNFPIVFE